MSLDIMRLQANFLKRCLWCPQKTTFNAWFAPGWLLRFPREVSFSRSVPIRFAGSLLTKVPWISNWYGYHSGALVSGRFRSTTTYFRECLQNIIKIAEELPIPCPYVDPECGRRCEGCLSAAEFKAVSNNINLSYDQNWTLFPGDGFCG